MSKYAKNSSLAKKGSVDSKYFGRPEQFESDVQMKIDKRNNDKYMIKNELIKIIENDPAYMERNYKLIIENLIELKKEYGF